MTKAIALAGFEAVFAADPDPWRTFVDRDEARKRRAILRAVGPGTVGRVLEIAAGNGSNSVAIAPRALRLDATEATAAGTRLVAAALAARGQGRRARALRLTVPARLPRARYDVVVIAELLYYLTPDAMRRTARIIAAALRPGGVLVLAHHRLDFHDFTQHAPPLHRQFLRQAGVGWIVRPVAGNRRWRVITATRP